MDKHKLDFYYSSWAKYELAVPATMRPVPRLERIEQLAADYRNVQVMLFGAAPAFDFIIRSLADLEAEINATRS